MLEGLINNNPELPVEHFNLNSQQIYYMTRNEDKDLNAHIIKYKTDYNLSTIDVYVNMAMIHGQIK